MKNKFLFINPEGVLYGTNYIKYLRSNNIKTYPNKLYYYDIRNVKMLNKFAEDNDVNIVINSKKWAKSSVALDIVKKAFPNYHGRTIYSYSDCKQYEIDIYLVDNIIKECGDNYSYAIIDSDIDSILKSEEPIFVEKEIGLLDCHLKTALKQMERKQSMNTFNEMVKRTVYNLNSNEYRSYVDKLNEEYDG